MNSDDYRCQLSLLFLHNRYQLAGGEDAAVRAETQLLDSRGHCVELVSFDNERLTNSMSISQSAVAAAESFWSHRSALKVQKQLATKNALVAHVHNFFPVASPSIHTTARNNGVAVVQTLHNYRLLCPNALFFRDGHVCEDCLGRFVPWPGVAHACYRDSYTQTGVTAAMLTVHRARRTWHREVDRFIALTEFSRQKFIEGGLPADKIVVKPNFIDRPDEPVEHPKEYFLFVGRLVDYKGVDLLPKAWQLLADQPSLRIAGDGPARKSLSASIGDRSIELLGSLPHESTMKQFERAHALILPSILYENFPMTLVESFAAGVPVIASNLGAMAEIVDDHRTGLLFEPGNAADLAAKVRWAHEHPDKMREYGMNARREYELKYTAERNYEMLMDIYQQAIEHRKTHPPARWPK